MEEEDQQNQPNDEEQNPVPSLSTCFPISKIKRIMKLDRDVNKTTSEATILIAMATELFIASLADGSRNAVVSRKRRVIRSDDVRSAVRNHGPTADFLLDCLSPTAAKPSVRKSVGDEDKAEEDGEEEIVLPSGTRRIDQIFQKVSVDSETVMES